MVTQASPIETVECRNCHTFLFESEAKAADWNVEVSAVGILGVAMGICPTCRKLERELGLGNFTRR